MRPSRSTFATALACLFLSLPAFGVDQLASPSTKKGPIAMEDSATRFGRHLQQVMRQPDVASVQDELVLHAGLLMQDALADQEMPSHEVQASREIITGTLCPGAEARCGKVKACLETIIGLYHPQEADHQEVSAAVAALMSEIVDWLDEHSVAIPVK